MTGIEEHKTNDVAHPILQILPNPVKTFFTIKTDAVVQKVELYDVLGKLIKTADMREIDNGNVVSVEQLSAGVYLVRVIIAGAEIGRQIVQKVIKVR